MANEKTKAVKLRELAGEYELKQNFDAAYHCLHRAADKGDHESQYKLGMYFWKGHIPVGLNRLKALRFFHKASDKNPEAKKMLSLFIEEGSKVANNEKAASGYYKTDLYTLGRCYLEGIGVEKNIDKGLELCRSAADFDDKAMMYLAKCYENGIHVRKNLETAFHYYLSASKKKFKCMKTLIKIHAKLADFYKNGIEGALEPDFNKYFYYRRLDTNRDPIKIEELIKDFFQHYELLVEKGLMGAEILFNLGYLYFLKFETEPEESNKKKIYGSNCFNLLELAADKDYPEAQYMLGSFCETDSNNAEDQNEKLELIEQASQYYYKSYFNLSFGHKLDIKIFLKYKQEFSTLAGDYLKKIEQTEAFQEAIPSLSFSKLLSSSMGSGGLINSSASNTASESLNAGEKKPSFTL